MRECARCGQLRRNHGRGLCGNCYKQVRITGRLDDYPRRPWVLDESRANPARLIMCRSCERRMLNQARGLCDSCYKRAKADGRLHEYPRRNRSYAETWEEYDFLAECGLSLSEIAASIGITKGALEKALSRRPVDRQPAMSATCGTIDEGRHRGNGADPLTRDLLQQKGA